MHPGIYIDNDTFQNNDEHEEEEQKKRCTLKRFKRVVFRKLEQTVRITCTTFVSLCFKFKKSFFLSE